MTRSPTLKMKVTGTPNNVTGLDFDDWTMPAALTAAGFEPGQDVVLVAAGDPRLASGAWQRNAPTNDQVRACPYWWVRGISDPKRECEPARFRVDDDFGVEVECGSEWHTPREGFAKLDGCEFSPCIPPTNGDRVSVAAAELARLKAIEAYVIHWRRCEHCMYEKDGSVVPAPSKYCPDGLQLARAITP